MQLLCLNWLKRHDHRCIQKYVSYSCMSTMLKIIQHPEIVFNIALFTRSMTYEYQTTCTIEFAIPCPWHRRHFRYPPHSPCDQTSHSGAAPPGDTSGAIRWFQKTWTWGDSRLITNVYMNYIICRYVYLYTSFLSMHVYNVYIYICTGSTERRILFFGGLSVWNRSWLLVAGQRTQNHAGAEAPSRRRQASSRWRFLWTFLPTDQWPK